MSSFGRVKLTTVWKMLQKCASDYEAIEGKHYYEIRYKGKTFPRLSTGPHKKNKNQSEIEIGHVRQMVRHLDIDSACAKRELPALR